MSGATFISSSMSQWEIVSYMETVRSSLNQKLWGISLIMAPLLFALSTFFWENGEYGITAGTILVISMVFVIPASLGLFSILMKKAPRYAVWGFLPMVYGCIAGANFAFVGVYSAMFNISHEVYLEKLMQHSLSANLLLFWPGPLFPLSLLLLGIVFIKTRSVPVWVGVLFCLAGIAFPLSRIPRLDLVAHLADMLMLLPMGYLGWNFLIGTIASDSKTELQPID